MNHEETGFCWNDKIPPQKCYPRTYKAELAEDIFRIYDMDNNGSVDFQVNKTNQKTCFNLSGIPNHRHNHQWGKQWGKVEADFSVGNQTLNKEPSKGKQGFSSFSIVLSKLFRIFDRDGDKSVSRCEMKGIVENLFHLIAESRREDKSPKEVKTKLQVCLKDELALYFNIFIF